MILKTIDASLWKASFLIAFLVFLQSCTPKIVSTSTGGAYKEDISKYRPEIEKYEFITAKDLKKNDSGSLVELSEIPAPVNHIKSEIDLIVDMTIDYNKARNFYPGFSIQVYSGTEVREQEEAVLKVYSLKFTPRTEFTTPIYRTKIRKQYYSRLEANKDLRQIKKSFPLAVLVSEEFKID